MLSGKFRYLKGFFIIRIPGLDRTELVTDMNQANMNKVKAIAITFIVLQIIRSFALLISKSGRESTQVELHYFAMYLSLILVMILFLGIFIKLEKNVAAHKIGIPAAGIVFTTFLLFWCAGISLLDQYSYGQITVYLMAIISIAVVPIFQPIVFFLIYIASQTFFCCLLPYVQNSDALLSGHYTNSTLFIILSLVIARIRYKNWLEDYKNKKIIQQKSDEIEKINMDLKEANQKLEKLAQIDSLSGIYNRSMFDRMLQKEWDRCRRYQIPLSLYMIDIDCFKAFNDNYGHQAGDECIRQVAKSLSGCMRRASDAVSRYGGDEFSVILPHMGHEKATALAERIKVEIAELLIPHEFSLISKYVTISIGVHTVVPSDRITIGEFLMIADKALYQAKKERNAVSTY